MRVMPKIRPPMSNVTTVATATKGLALMKKAMKLMPAAVLLDLALESRHAVLDDRADGVQRQYRRGVGDGDRRRGGVGRPVVVGYGRADGVDVAAGRRRVVVEVLVRLGE